MLCKFRFKIEREGGGTDNEYPDNGWKIIVSEIFYLIQI